MNIAIIENEQVATHHLEILLAESGYELTIVAVLDSIEAAVKFFERKPNVELVFMDIELGDGQSFNILQQTSFDAPIIFTTAYKEHALKAFKLNSVDYLLKPINKSELTAALDKFINLHAVNGRKTQETILLLLQQTKLNREEKTRYLARTGTRLISVSVDTISYFYTKDRLQYIKTVKGENYVIDKRLDEIEMEINSTKFFRVNRQFILSYDSIDKVHAWFSGKLKISVQPDPYEEILVSRLKAQEFKRWLGE